MRYPVNYIGIKQGFSSKHYGIDFGWNKKHGGEHQPIYAVDDGEIIYKSVQKTGGKVLHIKHSNGYVSEYGHLASWYGSIGDKVKKGQKIGTMGQTGIAKGCHLHFGLYKGSKINYNDKSKFVNPINYLCKFNNQTTSLKSKLIVKYKTKKVKTDLWVHNEKNYKKHSRVFVAKKNSEIEYYGKSGQYACVDNLRKYYCSNKYLK